MKTITRDQLQKIANSYGMSCDVEEFTTNPSIYEMHKGKPYGFEATEVDGDNLSGFRFFGESKFQTDLIDVWNEITNPEVMKPMLTVEAAKTLIGKIVRCSYCDVNNGEEQFKIIAIEKEKNKSIGQDENYLLRVIDCERTLGDVVNNRRQIKWGKPIGASSTWPYEWQGIFRRGSGAERLFIEEVI